MDTLIQDVPETSSDERMHILDETCWCKPTIDGDYLRHHEVEVDVEELRDGFGNVVRVRTRPLPTHGDLEP